MSQTQEHTRSRTYEWTDPSIVAAELGSTSGLDILQAVIDGHLPGPPVMNMVGVDRLEAEHGRVVVYLTPQEFHYNPLGSVHGGFAGQTPRPRHFVLPHLPTPPEMITISRVLAKGTANARHASQHRALSSILSSPIR